ncbi:aspartic proteinase PCS1 [Ricinus communis]|uniref:Aspartic proteinase nepenthesin-1, putative n=1 Tax=Ricinus communis TaxID=3988 RepID=B9T2R1_RICCO|nr:aspartic proteinase PCS1 [Ricinus communis]EEF29846.1 Aspartic proteinase nepenthesin-1 precursor, putative [Ricinus communis]|eukprot:XP_002532530.1 aspartic proteinase PCS1 [Ricinus communis]
MAISTMLLFLFLFFTFVSSSSPNPERTHLNTSSFSFSFPLRSLPASSPSKPSSPFRSSFVAQTKQPSYNYRSSFKYSMALIVSLPIGTPPQTQQMVLDTGSQLSWIQCHKKSVPKKPPPTTSFDPSLSSSFSVLPCNHPLCKPRIPDFTLPTTCDQNRLCHYSYFYADGTYAEGSLVREKITFSSSQSTPPLILGCAEASTDEKGILGMNLGRRSFASQAKISKFSYCVPTRQARAGLSSTGSFYLGNNPNSGRFQYINLLTFTPSQRSPNLDPLAYTIPMQGIRMGNARLNISATLFRPDPSGAGQTIIDSGSEFTYLVDEAYNKVREEVVRLVGPKLKKGYVYGGVSDMCFDGNPMEIGRLIGNMVFEFEKGVEIVIDKWRVLADVGGGVHCIGIGRSEMLGAASNIIGNFHQQNLWVEYDLANRRIGLGKADCSRSV